MTLPFFRANDDPGPSFVELLATRRRRRPAHGDVDRAAAVRRSPTAPPSSPSATPTAWSWPATAGPRRGNLISHRTMEKVFPADRHSGVAIAGAAGPAMEMVKLFQLQLEHYEKVEGAELSLEGKANQLSPDGAQPPAGRHAGPRRRAAVRRLRHPPRLGPPVPVRRHRRPLRGERLRHHRLGQPPRRHRRQARLPRRPRPRATPSTSPSRRCSRRPTRTPPPAAPTSSAASTRRSPPSPPTASSGSTTTRSPSASGRCSTACRRAESTTTAGTAPTMRGSDAR